MKDNYIFNFVCSTAQILPRPAYINLYSKEKFYDGSKSVLGFERDNLNKYKFDYEKKGDSRGFIDYKTSNSSSFSKYRRELCYYKLLVENVCRKPVSRVGVFFTKNGRLRLLDICDEENKPNIVAKVTFLRSKIKPTIISTIPTNKLQVP